MFQTIFDNCKKDIETNNIHSEIYHAFLNTMSKEYLENTTPARKAIDFIAGMTDDYMKKYYQKLEERN